MYYIIIFTSTDYYTMYEGYTIVKANSSNKAIEKAKKQFEIKNNWTNTIWDNGVFSVETIIQCGNVRPKQL